MNQSVNRFFDSIKGKTVAFIGIGTSNLPLIRQFAEKGAKVQALDRKDFDALGENGVLAKQYGAELILGEHYLDNIDADIVFRSPGTPFYKQELVAVRESGKVLTSEMEVFFDLCPCRVIAVTGSDGKTTTTTIISELLKAAGKTVHLGGNIGKPLLPEIENIQADDFAVVELSSFQLISMRKSPEIAVVTNLAPNHLDIHKDMQEYIDSKRNIVLHQNAFSKTVLNLDNEITHSFSAD
ncbi:MAG: UDP-N-acetylmuramoyl-L-alanine--D-glutamate ligase, partial [Ruminococcus sp.]|nr:UDP-N-acetylmuramoyl-L-alanine--D-glutamate ligase [Ruminococcus sp.]